MPAVLKRDFRRGADAGGARRGGVPWASRPAGTWPGPTPRSHPRDGGGSRTLSRDGPDSGGDLARRAGALTRADPRAAFPPPRRRRAEKTRPLRPDAREELEEGGLGDGRGA